MSRDEDDDLGGGSGALPGYYYRLQAALIVAVRREVKEAMHESHERLAEQRLAVERNDLRIRALEQRTPEDLQRQLRELQHHSSRAQGRSTLALWLIPVVLTGLGLLIAFYKP